MISITGDAGIDEAGVNPQRWASLFGLCVLTGLVWLTASDISIALPTIGRELGGNMDSLQWAVNGYFLTGSLIIVGGRLGDIVGRRLLFQIGAALLIAGSVVAMTAGGVEQLVLGRLIEGVGAAAILPSSLALVAVGFPEAERSKAIGIWIATAWGGQGVGPLIGGALVQGLGWQAIFWINIPLGLAAMWFVQRTTPESNAGDKDAKLDIPGAVVLVAAIALLSFALVSADTASTGSLLETLGASLALFVIFVVIERHTDDPLVPLTMFRIPSFVGSVTANLLANAAFGAIVFMMSLYLQVVLGDGALKAGALLLPATVTVLIVNQIGERLTRKQIYRLPISLGMLFLAIGSFLLTSLGGDYLSLLPGFILIGIGVGLQITPATELAIDSSGVGEGVASGVFKSTSMIGGSLGVAAATSVFQNFSADDLNGAITRGDIKGYDITHLLDVMTGSVSKSSLPTDIAGFIDSAFEHGAGNAMWVAAGAAIIGIVTSLLLLNDKAAREATSRGQ